MEDKAGHESASRSLGIYSQAWEPTETNKENKWISVGILCGTISLTKFSLSLPLILG